MLYYTLFCLFLSQSNNILSATTIKISSLKATLTLPLCTALSSLLHHIVTTWYSMPSPSHETLIAFLPISFKTIVILQSANLFCVVKGIAYGAPPSLWHFCAPSSFYFFRIAFLYFCKWAPQAQFQSHCQHLVHNSFLDF